MAEESGNGKKYLGYISLGAEIAAALALPVLAGYWADSTLDTSPALLLTGIFIGILLVVFVFVRLMKTLNRN